MVLPATTKPFNGRLHECGKQESEVEVSWRPEEEEEAAGRAMLHSGEALFETESRDVEISWYSSPPTRGFGREFVYV